MSLSKITLPTHDDSGPIDYLEEDPELPNQRYVVVSFLSPEKIIKQKQEFYFEKFIQWADYDWKVKGMEHFVAFLSKKYSIQIDDIMKDVREFEKTHKEEMKKSDIGDKYATFLLKHEKEVQEAFDKEVGYICNTRGVKVRRAFGSYEEAQLWCKVLQRKYPKDNIVIGKMGCWLPWDPSEHLIENVEYHNQQLNDIMRKYKENEANRELFFAEEREEAIRKQKEENTKKKETYAVMDAPSTHPAEGALRDN
jgi:hypothetical protein